MKITLLSVSAALAASAALLSTFGPAVVVVHAEPSHLDLRNVTNIMISATARDPNIVTTELKDFVPPRKNAWLDAKASDIDPLFMRSFIIRPLDDQIAGISKLGHGSSGVAYAENGGGSRFIDHQKSGRFTVGGGYLVGAGESVAMTGKDLSG